MQGNAITIELLSATALTTKINHPEKQNRKEKTITITINIYIKRNKNKQCDKLN